MKTKLIKTWYLVVLFFIWIGTMFLPSTVNQEKLDTVFYISKSKEDFFYLLINQIPYDTIILILMIFLSVFYTLKNHYFGKYFAFASLTLYISVFIIRIPLSFIFVKPFEINSTYGGLSRFWAFYGLGYVTTSILGLIFLFSLLYYAIFQLMNKSDDKP
ncbi:hypothetical protein [Lactococcus lactis]|uniref:hypothetical protein n=1 Tax=Lactococcus lactis TaxID=1358 RepID=UPI0022E06063|nr:hypothetical protein [Lactococcus lactis]